MAQILTISNFKLQHNVSDVNPAEYITVSTLQHTLYKLGLTFETSLVPTTDFADELLRRIQILYDKAKNAVIHQLKT